MKFNNAIISLMFTMTFLISCSKDISVDKVQIDGSFKGFEGELDGDIFNLPFEGFSIEIKIKRINEEDAMVEVNPFGNGKPIDFPDQICSIKTDSDGFVNLVSLKDGSMYVIFYDKETIDCYPVNGTRISGSRNGKKPSWWDD